MRGLRNRKTECVITPRRSQKQRQAARKVARPKTHRQKRKMILTTRRYAGREASARAPLNTAPRCASKACRSNDRIVTRLAANPTRPRAKGRTILVKVPDTAPPHWPMRDQRAGDHKRATAGTSWRPVLGRGDVSGEKRSRKRVACACVFFVCPRRWRRRVRPPHAIDAMPRRCRRNQVSSTRACLSRNFAVDITTSSRNGRVRVGLPLDAAAARSSARGPAAASAALIGG